MNDRPAEVVDFGSLSRLKHCTEAITATATATATTATAAAAAATTTTIFILILQTIINE